MRTILIASVLFLALLFAPRRASAEALAFNISTDQMAYNVGDTINWTVTFDVTGSTAATNFGIANIDAELTDSLGEIIPTASGTISATTFTPGVYVPQGGTYDGTSLIGLGAASFIQSALSAAQHSSPSLTGLPFATGSYVASIVGTHDLTVAGGPTNQLFGGVGALNSTATNVNFSPVTGSTASFSVVPEPGSTCMLVGLGLVGLLRRRRA